MVYIVIKNGSILQKYIPGTKIEELLIPEDIEVIGTGICCPPPECEVLSNSAKHAFYNWDDFFHVKRIHIPSSVKRIEPAAFMSINNLEAFSLEDGCTAAKLNDGVLFSKDGTRLICCPPQKEDKYIVPDGVEIIGENAFDRTCMEAVIFPNSLKEIEDDIFNGSFAIKTVYIPASVKKIGVRLFDDLHDENPTIQAPAGSFAIKYAKENGYDYEEV